MKDFENAKTPDFVIPWPRESSKDAERMKWMFDQMMFGLGSDLLPPPTPAQLQAGYATYPHGDHDPTVEVGWRREQTRAREDFRREAEMVACPYVACECGHHEP